MGASKERAEPVAQLATLRTKRRQREPVLLSGKGHRGGGRKESKRAYSGRRGTAQPKKSRSYSHSACIPAYKLEVYTQGGWETKGRRSHHETYATVLAAMTLIAVASSSLAVAASSLNNGIFETGDLTGWSVDTTSGGGASAVDKYTYYNNPQCEYDCRVFVLPHEGSSFALLTLAQIGPPMAPSISQPFEASNGDKVSGWAFFHTYWTSYDLSHGAGDDTAQVVIKNDSGTTVATPFEDRASWYPDGGTSGWKYWEHAFTGLTGTGQFRIEARLQFPGPYNCPWSLDGGCSAMGLDDVKTTTASNDDTTPPETFIDSGPSGTITVANATFSFSSSEATSTFECRLDGATYSACTSPKDYTNLSNGAHTFDVRAKDGAGNADATPASSTFTVDTIPPETSITSGPAEGSSTTSKSATFSFSSEANSTFECKLDSAAFSACSSPKYYTGLAKGSHTFQVRATDAAGNTDATPASRTWKVRP